MNDGGPAFPTTKPKDFGQITSGGMSLRDYFAGQALIGLVDRWGPSCITQDVEIARFTYRMADAMLAVRQPHNGEGT